MLIVESIRRILKRVARTHVRVLLGLAGLLIAFGTVGIYLMEKPYNEDFRSWWDCFWWAIVTMSTVGYGDKVPLTTGGRIIAMVCMVGGPILLVSLVGSLGALIYDEWQRRVKGMSQVVSQRHILICGWNSKARDILQELRLSQAFRKWPVTIIDEKTAAKPVEDRYVSFVRGNASEVSTLEQANVRRAGFAIILADGPTPAADQKTVLTVLAIKDLNPSILSCAELNDAHNEAHLRRAGCDVVVTASALTAKLLAMSIENPAVNRVVKELVSRAGNEIYRVLLPQPYVGLTFEQCFRELKSSHEVIIIGVERQDKCLLNPASGFLLQEGDFLLVISQEPPILTAAGKP